ncbi:hypothetical protein PL392_06980 [Bifidobacterium adolescentis]|nr:hypothetical protein [Bifidobacterium adolescentis]MDB0594061.1 hypothetical protein [Bifidobacterium adolescentis]MDB0608309.1 hypothetical protein [Bifidobacterium adolescentis]
MSEKTRRDKTLKLIEDGDDDDWKTAVFILPSTRLSFGRSFSGSGFYFFSSRCYSGIVHKKWLRRKI